MEASMFLILAVMVAAGVFGGFVNFFLTRPDDDPKPSILRSVTVGTGAAFMVPLFLNMISSNLIDTIRGTGNTPGDHSKLFVFAGFCLVAAISSTAFIRTLSDRILREAREARREAEEAREEVAGVQREIGPILAKETESEDGGEPILSARPESGEQAPEQRVLSALIPRRWTLRSQSGIAKETKIDRLEVSRILDRLVQQGLVGRSMGKNGPRWFLTDEGRRSLGI